jgi:hypothetical protein
MKDLAVLILAWVAIPASATAQTAFNPSTLRFNQSSDHATQLADGTNVLTGYRAKHFLKGASAPIMTTDLCKPVPDVDGVITVALTASSCPSGGLIVASPLVANTTYETRITAYGPGGESEVSLPSNPFVLL